MCSIPGYPEGWRGLKASGRERHGYPPGPPSGKRPKPPQKPPKRERDENGSDGDCLEPREVRAGGRFRRTQLRCRLRARARPIACSRARRGSAMQLERDVGEPEQPRDRPRAVRRTVAEKREQQRSPRLRRESRQVWAARHPANPERDGRQTRGQSARRGGRPPRCRSPSCARPSARRRSHTPRRCSGSRGGRAPGGRA